MRNKSFLITIAILIIASYSVAQVTGTFADSRDAKTYKTVKIGTQTWMAENLAFKADSGCLAYDNNQSNVTTYGYLYNWETAKKACPSGWHLPSDAEWTTLTTFLGGKSIAGGKMKETGTTHWQSPNTGATNESGFTALPAGYHLGNGKFDLIGASGCWWSSSENKAGNALYRSIDYDGSNMEKGKFYYKSLGFSVRCLKD